MASVTFTALVTTVTRRHVCQPTARRMDADSNFALSLSPQLYRRWSGPKCAAELPIQRNAWSFRQAPKICPVFLSSPPPRLPMSSTISTGTPYHIWSPRHPGGYLGTSGANLRILQLGADRNDDSQKWTFRAGSASESFRIESSSFSSLFASVISDSGYIWSVLESDRPPAEWYVLPTNESSYYRICQDPACSSFWVPSNQIGDSTTGDDVVLTAATTSRGSGSEQWRITPASFSATSIASSSTTSTSSTSTSTSTSTSSMSSNTPPTSTQENPSSETSPVSDSGDALQALRNCAPCGDAKCSFTPSGSPKKVTYSVVVGQPVSNCNNRSEETTTTKLGGTFELQETFSVEVTATAGLGFVGPSISTTVGSSESRKIAQTQEIEVSIRPGQIGALVANISYTTQPGQVSVDDSLK